MYSIEVMMRVGKRRTGHVAVLYQDTARLGR